MKTNKAGKRNFNDKKPKHKSLKYKIRGIQRMLNNKKDMDPSLRKQFEEQIEDLKAQIDAKAKQSKVTKLHKKYKGVKFIGFLLVVTRFFIIYYFILKILFYLLKKEKKYYENLLHLDLIMNTYLIESIRNLNK